MKMFARENIVDRKYILITGVAVILSWVLHEFAHWIAGRSLGYSMIMTFNSTYPVDQKYLSNTDFQIVSAAGPLFTLMQAIVIFIFMQQRKIKLLYSFLFTCFYMRLLATVISFLKLNDEARISKSLGIGTFTLPITITAILFLLVYETSQKYKFTKKTNLITLSLVMFYSSVIILADRFYHIQILH